MLADKMFRCKLFAGIP